MSVSDWLDTLNNRVFFWLHPAKLDRLLRAPRYRASDQDVLVVDTRSLLDTHGANVRLSPINSGATLYPNATPRGSDTFTTIEAYPYDRPSPTTYGARRPHGVGRHRRCSRHPRTRNPRRASAWGRNPREIHRLSKVAARFMDVHPAVDCDHSRLIVIHRRTSRSRRVGMPAGTFVQCCRSSVSQVQMAWSSAARTCWNFRQ